MECGVEPVVASTGHHAHSAHLLNHHIRLNTYKINERTNLFLDKLFDYLIEFSEREIERDKRNEKNRAVMRSTLKWLQIERYMI